MAECNGCGNCCNPVILTFDTYSSMLKRSELPDPAIEPEAYGDNELRLPEAKERWLNGQWARHSLEVTSVDYGTEKVVCRCRNYDVTTGQCMDYDNRPPVCVGYPWYGADPMESGRIPVGIECSYWADVEFSRRPDGWMPLSETDVKLGKRWSQWRPEQRSSEPVFPSTTPGFDELVAKLVPALQSEFSFLAATDDDWIKSARSILTKMGTRAYESERYGRPTTFAFEGVD